MSQLDTVHRKDYKCLSSNIRTFENTSGVLSRLKVAPASWSAVIPHPGRRRSLASSAPLSSVVRLSSALLAIAKRCRASLATRTPRRSRAPRNSHMDCGSLLPLSDASLLARTSFPFVHISPFGGSRAAYLKAAAGCRSPKTSSF